MLLCKRYVNNNMAAMRYYGEVILHLQQYSRRLNLLFLLRFLNIYLILSFLICGVFLSLSVTLRILLGAFQKFLECELVPSPNDVNSGTLLQSATQVVP